MSSGDTTLFGVVSLIFPAVAHWMMFEKAGAAGWKCSIPFRNGCTALKIARGNGWLSLLSPIVTMILGFGDARYRGSQC
ncbi:MAG: hypothetical protein Q4D89_06390 [Arachnia propionica]|uniref:hypothetical protein n=1 Tax=Arachnia propionica TaxID=1750 RepID=UPI00270BCD84|nr:hypothetical protein [Arachnia propionica]